MAHEEPFSRTFTWSTMDGVDIGYLLQLSGLKQLEEMLAGRIPPPPVMKLIGMDDLEVQEGRAVVTMRAEAFHCNQLGAVHGGILATLLDTAAACAVHSTLAPGMVYTSLDLITKYLRPVTPESGLLRCEGTLLSRGRRTALAQANLYDADNRLLAHATSTCLILPFGQ